MYSSFSLLLLGSNYVGAAVLSPAAPVRALIERRAIWTTSSWAYQTLGYSSAGMEGESTIWAPYEWDGDYAYLTSSGDYYKRCYYTYSYTTFSDSSYSAATISTSCPMYTSCSLGVMIGPESISSQCAGNGYICVSELLYQTWGAEDAATNIICTYSSSVNDSTAVSFFAERPAAIVSTQNVEPTTTPRSTPISTSDAAPGNVPSTSSAEPTSAPPTSSGGGGGNSNNTGIIAGTTVGGIAVLGAIGVAVLYILKRAKRYENVSPGPLQPTYPIYQPEKPFDPNGAPEYNPHASAYYANSGASPSMASPMPTYPEGYTRGELSGVRSPVQTQDGR
ncbi:hypothetical protein CC78DRAFT_253766 [Lojkania enalia]|uniref:Mid2 domain-containing protein n=1 Tax=Lojkania enalia TaxID=147567 RepID=A0A9P4K760_9PLEO|nr:hypothetical protein CC78DRAFT_253766 [Didymosphaeria enalia]